MRVSRTLNLGLVSSPCPLDQTMILRHEVSQPCINFAMPVSTAAGRYNTFHALYKAPGNSRKGQGGFYLFDSL